MTEAVAVEAPATPQPHPLTGDVPEFIKQAGTFPYSPEKVESQKPAEQAPAPTEKTVEPEKAKEVETPDERPKGKSNYERRLDRAYRREAEAKARAEFAERRAQELEAKFNAPKPVDGEPKLEQFSDIEEYAKAKADWKAQEALKEHEAKRQQESVRSEQQKVLQEWEEKVADAAEKYDDFDQVVGKFVPNSHWGFAMAEADNGADIAYFLSKHPKELQRITALPPRSQIREIGKLEAKLSATPAAPKQPSKAPAPITPVSGTAQPENTIRDGMSFEEFKKLRNRQLGRR